MSIPVGSKICTDPSFHMFNNTANITHGMQVSTWQHPFGKSGELIFKFLYLKGEAFLLEGRINNRPISYFVTNTVGGYRIYMTYDVSAVIPANTPNYSATNVFGHSMGVINGGEIVKEHSLDRLFDKEIIELMDLYFYNGNFKPIMLLADYYSKYMHFQVARVENSFHFSKVT